VGRPVGDSVGLVMRPSERERRLSFGAAARSYARYRPRYPDELVDWILSAASRPVRDVADVGAGTGALTSSLVARAARVTAYEPDAAMLAELERQVPAARRVGCAAEHLPTPDASYDAILSAASWHWFDAERAAAEFARVLRHGGVVGVLWHVRDDRSGWMCELTDLMGGDEGTRNTEIDVRMAREMDAVLPGVELRTQPQSVQMTCDEVVGLVSTYSFVIVSPRREALLAEVRDLLRTHPDTSGRARVEVPYSVRAYRWRRP
jgi:SAM-dependent methyltransferase